jgi:hypothetical protein
MQSVFACSNTNDAAAAASPGLSAVAQRRMQSIGGSTNIRKTKVEANKRTPPQSRYGMHHTESVNGNFLAGSRRDHVANYS